MTSSSIQMYMHCAVKCVQLRPSNWDLWPRTGSTDFPVRTLEDRFTLQKKNGIGRFQSNYIFFDNTAYSPFSHINERVNACLCKIDLSPSFHLTACCDPSLALFDLTRTDHSCQLPREPLPVSVPRVSRGTEEQLAVRHLLGVQYKHCSCSSVLWHTATTYKPFLRTRCDGGEHCWWDVQDPVNIINIILHV